MKLHRNLHIKNPLKNPIPIINSLLFFLMIFTKSYGDAMLANNRAMGFSDDVKYLFLILATALGFLIILNGGDRYPQLLQKEKKSFQLVIIIWLIISIGTAFFNDYFHIVVIKYWIYIILPFVYAYSVIKTSSFSTIQFYFKAALIICFLCYVFVEKGRDLFSINNFLKVSYVDSSSPFESSYSAGASIALCAFFSYYRKGNRFWLLLSMIFCFLTFKRLALIMMGLYFLLPIITDKEKQICKGWILAAKTFFVIAPIMLSVMLKPGAVAAMENMWHINLDHFMQGRIILYHTLLNSEYRMAGLGTTFGYMNHAIGKLSGIELELLQMYLEVGVVGLAVFVNHCFNLAKQNIYCTAVVGFTMFNMLTSSSLSNPFSWVFLYLTIWCILYKTRQTDKTESNKVNAHHIMRITRQGIYGNH